MSETELKDYKELGVPSKLLNAQTIDDLKEYLCQQYAEQVMVADDMKYERCLRRKAVKDCIEDIITALTKYRWDGLGNE